MGKKKDILRRRKKPAIKAKTKIPRSKSKVGGKRIQSMIDQGKPGKSSDVSPTTASSGNAPGVFNYHDLLSKYLQVANLIIVTIDIQQKIIFINDKGCEILGYQRNQILGKNWFDSFIPEDQRDQIKAVFDKIISGDLEPAEHFENSVVTKSGQFRLIAWHNTFLKNDKGEIVNTLSSGEDITEKRQIEKALAEREKQFRMLIETMNDGLGIQDENGIITYVNDRICEMTGYSRPEMLGKSSLDFFDPKDHKFLKSQINERRTGQIGSFEITWIKKDGGKLHTIVAAKPIYDDQGIFRGTFGVVTDITDRKIKDETLKASEENYRTIFNAVNDAIFVHDLETGAILDVNQRMCEMYGYSPEEIRFFSVEGLSSGVYPYNIERASQLIKLAARGEPQLFNWHAKDKSGRLFWVEVSLKNAVIGGKNRVLAVVRDITERILAEEALSESQRALSTLMGNLPGMAYRCRNDLDWTMEFISDGCLALTGYPPFDVVENRKVSYGQLILAEDQPMVWHKVQEAINQKRSFQLIYRIKTADKKVKWVWEQGCGVFSRLGELRGIEGFIADMTEVKHAQDALEAEKERLAVTLRSIGDAVITTDIAGNIVLMNKVAELLTGWTQNEAIDRPLGDIFRIINEDTREPVDNPVVKVLKAGTVIGLANHTALISKNGKEISIADSGAPIRDKTGRIIGVVLVFREITEAKRLQEALIRAQRLETAGMVASQVAHDFNNLLAPLIAYPEFIKQELSKDSRAIKYLEDIETSALQMAEINQQLLILGRRGHYNLEPLNLNKIIEQISKQLQPIPDNLSIELMMADDLMNIIGGESQVSRLIWNLVNNAREAMHDRGILRIKTENQYIDQQYGKFNFIPRGEYVKLTVSDTGPGIPLNIQSNIFDPFFTTKTSGKKRGSGLGLSIVNTVTEDHNGFIDFESKPGKGTSFYLYFPITREPIETAISKEIAGGSEQILVVDDDHIQREVTIRLLHELGYKAQAVGSGEEAIEFIKTSPQDLLILDMIMPSGIDGAETYRQALEVRANQKAIVVSGYAASDRVKEALNLGAGAFVKKPLTMQSLAKAVRKELDRVIAE